MVNSNEATRHLPAQFSKEVGHVKKKLLYMGGLAEKCVSDVVNALVESDNKLLPDVVKSEEALNSCEIEIDEECIQILARRQPMACDLRMIVSIMKITANLERVGDEAERVVNLSKQSSLDLIPRDMARAVKHLAEQITGMLSDSIDSFVRLDSQLAREVILRDKEADEEYISALRQLITYSMQEPRYISHMMNIIWCARALERIGDHAKNIAEHVIYVDEAVDVRHHGGDDYQTG